MADAAEIVFALAVWASDLIYRPMLGVRSQRRILAFRISLLALGLVCLQKPLLRMTGHAEIAQSYTVPLAVLIPAIAAFTLGLIMLGVGEGHHDNSWNHRRGWTAALVATAIAAGCLMILNLNPAA